MRAVHSSDDHARRGGAYDRAACECASLAASVPRSTWRTNQGGTRKHGRAGATVAATSEAVHRRVGRAERQARVRHAPVGTPRRSRRRRLAGPSVNRSSPRPPHSLHSLVSLFHRRTRASYVYNVCLSWYNVVLYNCLSWYKFVNTHLYHSRQLYNIQLASLGLFYGAIAVPSVTRCRCRRRCRCRCRRGHRCAGGA